MRRKYIEGRCDDCGKHLRVTLITFWLNGFKMWTCRNCIKPYRDTILCPARVPIHMACASDGKACA